MNRAQEWTEGQINRGLELLDIIVRPGDHQFGNAIEEAQMMLGYPLIVQRFTRRKKLLPRGRSMKKGRKLAIRNTTD